MRRRNRKSRNTLRSRLKQEDIILKTRINKGTIYIALHLLKCGALSVKSANKVFIFENDSNFQEGGLSPR